jgi:hypothetical protein
MGGGRPANPAVGFGHCEAVLSPLAWGQSGCRRHTAGGYRTEEETKWLRQRYLGRGGRVAN